MTRLIPNENTRLVFCPTVTDLAAPTSAEIDSGTDLTGLLISLNASTRGNTVPTPSLDTLFETSIPGTVQASFDADFYRDDEEAEDVAWTTLARSTQGVFIISRFAGSGTDGAITGGDSVECWPVIVVSRTMANTASGTVLSFTASCSVPEEPVEDAVVAV